MEIEIGDRITYKYLNSNIDKDRIFVSLIEDIGDSENYKRMIESETEISSIEILKIERPKYEVVEEKEELLTKEEKEFLKQYLKFTSNEYEKKYCKRNTDLIWLEDEKGNGICFRYNIDNFKNMELSKEYTLQELGLEENS